VSAYQPIEPTNLAVELFACSLEDGSPMMPITRLHADTDKERERERERESKRESESERVRE
jgi:hypothetical protein